MEANKKEQVNTALLPNEKTGGLSYSAAVFVILSVSFLFSLVITSLGGAEQFKNENWYILLSYFLPGFALAVALFIVTKYKKQPVKPLIGKTNHWPLTGLIIALFAFGTFFGLSKLNVYFIDFIKLFGYTEKASAFVSGGIVNYLLAVLFIAVIPAVFEELLFRGAILNSLKPAGEIKAVLISALLFSFYHMSPEKTLYQFVIGLIYAFVAIRTGSIFATTILHFINNFVYATLLFFVGEYVILEPLNTILFVLGLLAIALAVLLLLFRYKKTEKGKGFSFKDFFIYAAPGIVVVVLMWITSLFG